MLSSLSLVIDIYMLILLARVIESWVGFDRRNVVVRFLRSATEPVLAPLRSLLPEMGGIDFSPVVAMLILSFLKRLL